MSKIDAGCKHVVTKAPVVTGCHSNFVTVRHAIAKVNNSPTAAR